MVLGHDRDKMLYNETPRNYEFRNANYKPDSVGSTKSKSHAGLVAIHHKMDMVILGSSWGITRDYK